MRARALAALALLAIPACGPSDRKLGELHQLSTTYAFTVSPSESPPHAREAILFKIVVRDRKSRQPIENGEGQIYSNNAEGASTWDGMRKADELGTYYGKLNYVTAGQWAVAIRFRRDSLSPLEKIEWIQDVMNERADAPVTKKP
ncbi:MAG: hypothetical protein JWO05_3039 [Gemmatimonadetes bacterium]|nr:hypothetical protein [Gemmatimonadota bacterium]